MRIDIISRLGDVFDSDGLFDRTVAEMIELDFKNNKFFIISLDGDIREVTNESSLEDKLFIKKRYLYCGALNSNKSLTSSQKNFLSTTYTHFVFKPANSDKFTTGDIENLYFGKILKIESLRENAIDKLADGNYASYKEKKLTIEDLCLTKVNPMDYNLFNKSKDLMIKSYEEIMKREDVKSISNKVFMFMDIDINIFLEEVKKYIYYKINIQSGISGKVVDNEIYVVPTINIANDATKKPFSFKQDPLRYNLYMKIDDVMPLFKVFCFFNMFALSPIYIPNNLTIEDLPYIKKPKRNCLYNEKVTFEVMNSEQTIVKTEIIMNNDEKLFKIKNYMKIKKENEVSRYEPITFNTLENHISNFIYLVVKRQAKPKDREKEYKKRISWNKVIVPFCNGSYQKAFEGRYQIIFMELLKELMKDKDISEYEIKNFLNYYLSLQDYFSKGDEIMRVNKLDSVITEKVINNKPIENLEEWLFLYGLTYRYIVNHNNSDKYTRNLFSRPTLIQSMSILKQELKMMQDKYNHKIFANNMKFSNALVLLLDYETSEHISMFNNTPLYMGLTYGDNLFYRKNEEINN